MSIMLRINISPNDPTLAAKHLVQLQNDIGPWMSDYAEEIAKPAVDFDLTPFDKPDPNPDGGGLQQ